MAMQQLYLQNTLTTVVFSVHGYTVQESEPLLQLLYNMDVGLILNLSPVRVDLSDGENTTVRDAKISSR